MQTQNQKSPKLEILSLVESLVSFNPNNFIWSPAEVCQFMMNSSMADLMDDYKEEQIVTR